MIHKISHEVELLTLHTDSMKGKREKLREMTSHGLDLRDFPPAPLRI